MAQGKKHGNLNSAAVSVGRTLGHVVNRLDKLHQQRDAISHQIHHLANSATELLSKMRHGVQTELAQVRAAVDQGERKVYKMSAAARRKMSIAAKKREALKRAAAARADKKS